jgi:hypothetical protein
MHATFIVHVHATLLNGMLQLYAALNGMLQLYAALNGMLQ